MTPEWPSLGSFGTHLCKGIKLDKVKFKIYYEKFSLVFHFENNLSTLLISLLE